MLPANVILRFLTPHYVLGGCVMVFGVLVASMAAAQNTATILALRILVGFAQAFIQGLGLYVSFWYKRDELATRSGKLQSYSWFATC